MRVLAGDIGGTKTLLALVDVDDCSATVVLERRYESASFADLDAIVAAFIDETGERGERACFAIAGPVFDNRSEATNLPWVVDARALRAARGLGPTRLINDFVAVAYGVLRLDERDLVTINPGARDPRGPIAVLGAGTGLGEAILVSVHGRYEVIPSEGGHADFAPRNEQEIGLLRWLLERHEHVSWERVVSGLGLRNIYAYLAETGAAPESEEVRAALARGEDLGALVGMHAVSGSDRLSAATVDLFVGAYGAEAGNLALKVVATGGVFVAGGIAPKILPCMTDGRFRQAFVSKGRLSNLVARIPVFVVTRTDVGLIGAAVAATMMEKE